MCELAFNVAGERHGMCESALNGALQTKRMADKDLHIAACQHIIAATLMLSIYTLQTKQFVTHKPDEQRRKNKPCIVAMTSLLAVGTNGLIWVFSVKG
jgi:hypothetical protein